MPNSQTWSAAIAQVDEEISGLTLQLCVLRRRRNTLVAIGRLPPELLIHIFDQYRCDDDWRGSVREYQENLYRLTHACSYWRNIAKQAGGLWNTIELWWPEPFVDWVILNGGHSWPIILHSGTTGSSVAIPRSVLDQVSRINTLGGSDSDFDSFASTNEIVRGIAEAPTSQLQSVCIEDFPEEGIDSISITSLLRVAQHSLQRVHLSHTGLDWLSIPSLSKLQYLYLADVGTEGLDMTIQQGLALLSRQCPRLRSLVSKDMAWRAGTRSGTPIIFPCLIDVEIKDTTQQITQMSDCLNLPLLCHTHINISTWSRGEAEATEIIETAMMYFCKLLDGGLRPFRLDSTRSMLIFQSATICVSSAALSIKAPDEVRNPTCDDRAYVDFMLDLSSDLRDLDEVEFDRYTSPMILAMASRVLPHLRPDTIESITVMSEGFCVDLLVPWIASLSNLRTLIISSAEYELNISVPTAIIKVLTPLSDVSPGTSSDYLPLPYLHEMEIHKLKPKDFDAMLDRDDIDAMLTRRRNWGAPPFTRLSLVGVRDYDSLELPRAELLLN